MVYGWPDVGADDGGSSLVVGLPALLATFSLIYKPWIIYRIANRVHHGSGHLAGVPGLVCGV